ncbi:MAG: pilus assembly protein [Pseudomonadales bacterium]
MKRALSYTRQRGQSATEFIIIAPVVFMLVFGCLQFALIYQAKTTLNYAAFNAARIAAVNGATLTSVRRGFVIGMAPFYTTDNNSFNVTDAVGVVDGLVGSGYVKFDRINPTRLAFLEFGEDDDVTGWKKIPNDNLMYRDAKPGASRVNIQDANLLKLQITFCYHLSFPVIRVAIREAIRTYNIGHNLLDCEASTNDPYTIPITSAAVIRMQSDILDDPAWRAWPYGSSSGNLLNLGVFGDNGFGLSRNSDAEEGDQSQP